MRSTPNPLASRERAIACATLLALTCTGRASARVTPAPQVAPVVATSTAVCRAPKRPLTLRLPGQPLSLAQTPDGCYLFVGFGTTLVDPHRGIVLLHRQGRSYAVARVFDTGGSTSSLTVSRDGSMLAAGVIDHGIIVIDVARAIGGDPRAFAIDLTDPAVRETAGLAFDADGSRLYALDKTDSAVLAIDLASARTNATSRTPAQLFTHRMPIDLGPDALALSIDGSRLYVLAASRSAAGNVQATCRSEMTAGTLTPTGVLDVFDLTHADRDGLAPSVARVEAGCDPAGLALSADGANLWIANHGSRELVAVSTALISGSDPRAVVAHTALSFSPDAVGTAAGGAYVIAAGYDRAADLQHQLAILSRNTTLGRSTLRARANIGRFPRSILPASDGTGAFVASYAAGTLTFYPLSYLQSLLEPPASFTHGKRRPAPHGKIRPAE